MVRIQIEGVLKVMRQDRANSHVLLFEPMLLSLLYNANADVFAQPTRMFDFPTRGLFDVLNCYEPRYSAVKFRRSNFYLIISD